MKPSNLNQHMDFALYLHLSSDIYDKIHIYIEPALLSDLGSKMSTNLYRHLQLKLLLRLEKDL